MGRRRVDLGSIITGDLGPSAVGAKRAAAIRRTREGDLAQGLQRAIQRRHAVDVFERNRKGKLERVTTTGIEARGRSYVSNAIRLTKDERAAANFYGGSMEILRAGGVGLEFMREAVDSTRTTHTVSERMFATNRVVEVAQDRLRELAPAIYACESTAHQGEHAPITARRLIDAFCVEGQTINHIAEAHGWWVMQRGQRIVPNRQAARIRQRLLSGLEAMMLAWESANIEVPEDYFTVETA